MRTPFLRSYLKELTDVFHNTNHREFDRFLSALRDAHARGAAVYVFGNGGSGSTASHFACDINKGASFGSERRFRVICLNDNIPTLLAYANDVSYDDVFVEQLKNFLEPKDLVIGISSSGNSRNVLKALEYAGSQGAHTFGLGGAGGGRMKTVARDCMIAASDDTQKIEDIHMIVVHCAMQCFLAEFKQEGSDIAA